MKPPENLTDPINPSATKKKRFVPPADWVAPEKTIAVVGGARSGSTLLCSLMAQTQRLGMPDEFFKKKPFRSWEIAKKSDTIELRCRLALSNGTSPNGVCGIKLFAHHVDRIQNDVSLFEWFPNPSFVWIHRRDLLGQAISSAIARQTGRYREFYADKGIVPEYSVNEINDLIEWSALEEARWREYFARTGITPHELCYEDLVKQPQEEIRKLSDFIGIPVDLERVDPGKSPVTVQRSNINAEWRERFLSECGDPNRVKSQWSLKNGSKRSKHKAVRRFLRIFGFS